MKTLGELIESCGPNLTPHIATLVPCLLKASGELEMPKLSYMSTQLAGHSEAQEMLDSVRAEAAKQHQSTETLTKVRSSTCIQSSIGRILFKLFKLHCSASDS